MCVHSCLRATSHVDKKQCVQFIRVAVNAVPGKDNMLRRLYWRISLCDLLQRIVFALASRA